MFDTYDEHHEQVKEAMASLLETAAVQGYESSAGAIAAAATTVARLHGAVADYRKGSNRVYVVHCFRVAELLMLSGCALDEVIAGLYHDTLENTRATTSHIEEMEGQAVRDTVVGTTNASLGMAGNRKQRKAADRAHIAAGTDKVQRVKLADICANLEDFASIDAGFARLRLVETEQLLGVIRLREFALMAYALNLLAWAQQILPAIEAGTYGRGAEESMPDIHAILRN